MHHRICLVQMKDLTFCSSPICSSRVLAHLSRFHTKMYTRTLTLSLALFLARSLTQSLLFSVFCTPFFSLLFPLSLSLSRSPALHFLFCARACTLFLFLPLSRSLSYTDFLSFSFIPSFSLSISLSLSHPLSLSHLAASPSIFQGRCQLRLITCRWVRWGVSWEHNRLLHKSMNGCTNL